MGGVKVVDKGWSKIAKELNQLAKTELLVGIQAGEKASKRVRGQIKSVDDDLAPIAAAHEFGVGVPQRSFLRSTIAEKQNTITRMCEQVVNVASSGGNTKLAVERVGQYVEGEVKKKIVRGPFVPNSPRTILAKGSSRPLIDTGRMRQSVRYVIRKKGLF